ncbi:Cell division cycle protein [Penicillium oxalicum]|uniref:Uncharacterized protein n=1 Tax=Penicillium oxalicum (strain 114-2 / CGMCC 5302) TaxID=933388 RepID=S7ZD85_PENO1|nr:Cell division cycle protein [Penicillium oxalicum]EPS28610.1 hypothetical protein PDE_03556 [Penicillium oxalicum 114-2]KAI2787327.1 Cell division cycle protein [Penicillium oxalicum]
MNTDNSAPDSRSREIPDRLPFPPVTYSHILHCSYHDWHPRYRSLIPKSRLIPLSTAFVNYLRADGIVLPPETRLRREDDELDDYDDSDEGEQDPSAEWVEIHAQIKNTIAELGGKVTPKLNWSAPKDATFMSPTNDTQCRSPNDIYLLLKSSDFITHDLEHPFDDCEPDFAVSDSSSGNKTAGEDVLPEVPYHLVLRQYVNFNPSLEFRCFVRNRKLLCMCQRDQNHFDFLFGMRDMLRSRIQSFFDEKLRDSFPDPNFVFDVYVPAPHQRVWLIDINPWAQRTDPLLFSWLEILRMNDPIGFEEEPEDSLEEGVVRISLRDGSVLSPHSDGESGSDSASEEEDDEEAPADGDDQFAPFLPEFRLIKKDDPESYSFNTPQFSAHKVPKELVDASLAGPGGMSEFLGKWQDILKQQEREDREADDDSA